MKCPEFSKWIENRDLYDVSEADRALKHAAVCRECKAKMSIDEKLDTLIYKAMQSVDMPGGLPHGVDLSLDRMSSRGSRRRYGFYGILSAVVAVMFVFFVSLAFTPSIHSIDDLGKHVIADYDHHGDSAMVVFNPGELHRLGDFNVSYDRVATALPAGYDFVGARICPLGECDSVHMVFHRYGKRVSIFLIRAGDVGFSIQEGRQYSMSEGSQTVNFWKNGEYIFAMIS